MSFILDALRKSEHDRQRTAGPALAEVPVAPARPRTNLWAPIAVALLVVNVAVIGVLLLRKSNDVAAPVASAPTAAGPTAAASSAPVAPPPVARPAPAPVPGGLGAQNPLADEAGGEQPGVDPELLAGAAAVPEGPPAVTSASRGRGSVVYESLPDSAVVGGPAVPVPMPAARPTPEPGSSSMPSADELAGAGVPALNLDLHVYTSNPAERMVFINSHKYREGDTLAEGPVVQQITPRGVVLEYGGRSYLLAQQ